MNVTGSGLDVTAVSAGTAHVNEVPRRPRHHFTAYGVELEYMLVEQPGLRVLPAADWLLSQAGDGQPTDVERGSVTWSNELALHLVEFKTTDPEPSLHGLAAAFAENVRHANSLLAARGACLLPTAMHPLMDPAREMRLWPHDYQEVYGTYDRIFGCQGHGWANLQSVHLNLPFFDDNEFARLHAAVRLVLPLLPALAASSPLIEGRYTAWADSRLEVYRHNSHRVPSLAGQIIPEPVFSEQAYRELILAPIYRDITPLDPEGILQQEWLNARGAIARFDRQTIEIRLLDLQECPRADLAICHAVSRIIQDLVEERDLSSSAQQAWSVERLKAILSDTIRDGDEALVRDAEFLAVFGMGSERTCTARELWRHLIENRVLNRPDSAEWESALRHIVQHGTLSRRIRVAVGNQPSPGSIIDVYDRLSRCLAENECFPTGQARGR